MWDVAVMLARLLMDETKYPNKFFGDRKFIELGAGLGLPGMIAALRGAKTLLTDIESVLPLLRQNVERNFANSENPGVAKLDWTTLDQDLTAISEASAGNPTVPAAPFDVVLVTDCVYQERLVKPLVDTLVSITQPGSVVLLTMRARFSFQADFLQMLKVWFSGMPLHPEERHLEGLTQVEDLGAWRLKRRAIPASHSPTEEGSHAAIPEGFDVWCLTQGASSTDATMAKTGQRLHVEL
eukprot:CAMPEP_0172926944 /NCGR_PEP_ID=MMETSP1075-20121228/216573_1 /TAXON_ID=2916 /ORGANISM="Ceratium fusus, Strain PA161109" /LENGTH=238 /DNA_ID=CAMNT_0013788109 /DNA_START=78 /DNA_END=792 /DNA_ORIENTATION=-